MRTLRLSVLASLFFSHLLSGPCPAATIVWTNSSGGLWSNPQNWSPNRVPTAAEDVVVTNRGTYSVTLDMNATVASLILGGPEGQQSLTNSSRTLTLANASLVETNGIMGLGGGALSAALLAVNGSFLWTGGTLSGGSLTVLTGATLNVSGAPDKTLWRGVVLTNAGTVVWTGAGRVMGTFSYHGQTDRIVNVAGGVFEVQTDAGVLNWNTGGWTNTAFVFENAGTFRKSGTAGTNVFSGVPFSNTGTVAVQSGTVRLASGGSLGGGFTLGTDAVWELAGGNFTLAQGAVFSGSGLCRVTSGTVDSGGGADFDCLDVVGGTVVNQGRIVELALGGTGTLRGANRVVGVMDWSGGSYSGGSLTVVTGATLNVSGAPDKTLSRAAVLTNAGTVVWTGAGRVMGAFTYHGQTNRIVNVAGGVFEVQTDAGMLNWNTGGWTNTAFLFENAGTFRKSGTAGTSVLSGVPFSNTGTVELRSGILRLAGNYAPSPNANLSVRIGGLAPGLACPQLQVAGKASLDGCLTIETANGFVPGSNDTFLILTSLTREGTFASLSREPLGPRTWYNPRYLPNGVELTLVDVAGRLTGVRYSATSHQAGLTLTGVAGKNYVIEAATDFQDWTPLATNTVPGSTLLDFLDVDSTNYAYRFYRARYVP